MRQPLLPAMHRRNGCGMLVLYAGGGAMMKPYYSEKGIDIYLGDCTEILPQLGIYDVVLTDPPYGNGDMWQGGTWGAQTRYSEDAKKWDDRRFHDKTLAEVRRSG